MSAPPFLFFFWLHRVACRILVPQPGMEPVPPALGDWSLNHWTSREVPPFLLATVVNKEGLSFSWKGRLFSGTRTQSGGCMEIRLGQVESIQGKKDKMAPTRMSGPVCVTFSGASRFFRWSQRIILKSRAN